VLKRASSPILKSSTAGRAAMAAVGLTTEFLGQAVVSAALQSH
jgi:hypothetical protein